MRFFHKMRITSIVNLFPNSLHNQLVCPTLIIWSLLKVNSSTSHHFLITYSHIIKRNFPLGPSVSDGRMVGGWVGRSFGRLVCHNFLKGKEVTLPCSYRGTYIQNLFFPSSSLSNRSTFGSVTPASRFTSEDLFNLLLSVSGLAGGPWRGGGDGRGWRRGGPGRHLQQRPARQPHVCGL